MIIDADCHISPTFEGGNSITATALEHLYDGSIIWSDGDEIWDGIVNYGNADVQIQIHLTAQY